MSQRRALIVATSRFDDGVLSELRSPGVDAAALASALGDPDVGGFQTDLVVDVDAAGLRRRVEDLFVSASRPDDLIVLYYSGHGVKDDHGRLYFASTDTDRSRLRSTSLPAKYVHELSEECRARQVLLLDCCYSGAYLDGTKGAAGLADAGPMLAGRGRVVLTASDSLQYAFEGDRVEGSADPSHFTAALVRGLTTGAADADGDGLITVDELYDFAFDHLRDLGVPQTPTRTVFGGEGQLVLARSPLRIGGASPSPPVEPPPPVERTSESSSGGRRRRVGPRQLVVMVAVGLVLCASALLVAGLRSDDKDGATTSAGVGTTDASADTSVPDSSPSGVDPSENRSARSTDPAPTVADLDIEPLVIDGLGGLTDVDVASDGSLVLADRLANHLWIVRPDGTVERLAGSGTQGEGGGSELATARIDPLAVAIDDAGRVYFSDEATNRIRVADPIADTVATVAGTGTRGTVADGVRAADGPLGQPRGLAFGPDRTLYFAEVDTHAVRTVDSDVRTGTAVGGNVGRRIAGSELELTSPDGVARSSDGTLYVVDRANGLLLAGRPGEPTLEVIAGGGEDASVSAAPADIQFFDLVRVAVDDRDRPIVVDNAGVVFRIEGDSIDWIAGAIGTGDREFPPTEGDGGPATQAPLRSPVGVAAYGGRVYIADALDATVRVIEADGTIRTLLLPR